jgi:hypothetical protein
MQVHLKGKKLYDGQTVTLDHSVQKFEVVIRSMSGVAPQRLKDLIQKSFEVVRINEIDRTDYVI